MNTTEIMKYRSKFISVMVCNLCETSDAFIWKKSDRFGGSIGRGSAVKLLGQAIGVL